VTPWLCDSQWNPQKKKKENIWVFFNQPAVSKCVTSQPRPKRSHHRREKTPGCRIGNNPQH
jgi:hypothetical protein